MEMENKLDRLIEAIARREGFFRPGSVAQRLNNPGNLIYVGQAGAKPHRITGADGKVRSFCEFPAPEEGFAALRRQIRLDAARGITLHRFVGKYAPSDDGNDPEGYAAFVSRCVAVPLDTPLQAFIESA